MKTKKSVAPSMSARDVLAASYFVRPAPSRVSQFRDAPRAYRVNRDGSVSFADRMKSYDGGL
jgi:hypothetical protein